MLRRLRARRFSTHSATRKTVEQLWKETPLYDRHVLVRADLNVQQSLAESGAIQLRTTDRLDAFLPTLQFLTERGAKCVVCSHLGRPKGPEPAASLRGVARYLERHSGARVRALGDCIGSETRRSIMSMTAGEVAMMENVRLLRMAARAPLTAPTRCHAAVASHSSFVSTPVRRRTTTTLRTIWPQRLVPRSM